MAPARTAGRNPREADYSNVGVAGRKTGVTLKDTGLRDEHGLEPMDGIFSSPEKSPMKLSGVNHQSTIEEEEDMVLGESTIPEPTEVLRSARNSKVILPPPKSRSPMKTNLHSSPRRSMGRASLGPSSPTRQNGDTPTRATSHPAANRRLDFSMEKARSSVERSLQRGQAPALMGRGQISTANRGKKRAFDLSMEDDDNEEVEAPLTNGDTIGEEDFSTSLANGDDSMALPQLDEVEEPVEEEQAQAGQEEIEEESIIQAKPKGRPRKIGNLLSTAQEAAASKAVATSQTGAMKSNSRPRRASTIDVEDTQMSVREPKPKGWPSKKAKTEAAPDDESEVMPETQSTRAKSKQPAIAKTPTLKQRGRKKAHPSERGPNAKITSVKKAPRKSVSVEPRAVRASSARPGPRSLLVLRSGTPAEDSGSLTTRSGRNSVKPLAFWRNERIVFGESQGKYGTSDVVLPSIKEVIRTDELEQPRPRYTAGRRKPVRNRRQLDDVDEDDEDKELWEIERGILQAEVVRWDPRTNDGEEEEIEIAYAAAAIETKPVRNGEFQFAKIFNVPFFATGMVDLPPKGEKRIKNSRKMHLVFFVHYGRVTVNVGHNADYLKQFSIGRGGSWQVPRGNFYSIANDSSTPARIFFAQGCELDSVEPPELEEIPERPAAKGKGKKTGKQRVNGVSARAETPSGAE